MKRAEGLESAVHTKEGDTHAPTYVRTESQPAQQPNGTQKADAFGYLFFVFRRSHPLGKKIAAVSGRQSRVQGTKGNALDGFRMAA